MLLAFHPCIAPFRSVLTTIVGTLILAACGGGSGEKAASQTAARVNRSEITVHQINFLLQQRQLPPEKAAQASKDLLERLIDQELTIQKATELKLDRDAKVVQQIEVAKREIISRAYIERISGTAAEPTPDEIFNYYDKNPSLFKNRRVGKFQELIIQLPPEKEIELRNVLSESKNFNEFIDYLRSKSISYSANRVVKSSEQFTFSNLEKFQNLKVGDVILNSTPAGLQVLLLAEVEAQPLEEPQVRSAIALFLLNERKNKIVENDIVALRSTSKIDYIGDFYKPNSDLKAAAK